MRAHSYRILVALTNGNVISVSVCHDEYRQGRLYKSDLVSLRNPLTGALWIEMHRACIGVYNAVRQHLADNRNPRLELETPPPDDACTASSDGAVQEPIPGC